MSKIYVPEDYIKKPCVEIYGHNVIRVYDRKPASNPEITPKIKTRQIKVGK